MILEDDVEYKKKIHTSGMCWWLLAFAVRVINHGDDTIAQRPPSQQRGRRRRKAFDFLRSGRREMCCVISNISIIRCQAFTIDVLSFIGAKVSFHFFSWFFVVVRVDREKDFASNCFIVADGMSTDEGDVWIFGLTTDLEGCLRCFQSSLDDTG